MPDYLIIFQDILTIEKAKTALSVQVELVLIFDREMKNVSEDLHFIGF